MMRGLVVFYHAKMFPEALQTMAGMIAKGELKLQEERFDGLAAMPEAFCGLFRGENMGRRVVKVGDE
jgi:NADPH-dependent curcumin reductase CurA